MFLTGLKGAEISVGAFLGRGFVRFAYPGITSWEGVVARTPLREEFHKIGLGFPDFSDGQEHLHPSTPHFRNWGSSKESWVHRTPLPKNRNQNLSEILVDLQTRKCGIPGILPVGTSKGPSEIKSCSVMEAEERR